MVNMFRIISLLILSVLCANAQFVPFAFFGTNTVAASTPSTINIFYEDFEGTDTPLGWYGTTAYLHSTTSALAGAHSMRMVSGTAASAYVRDCGSEVTWDCLVNYSAANNDAFLTLYDSAGNTLVQVLPQSDGTIVMYSPPDTYQQSVGTTTAGTPFYLRVHYKKGTGANAETELFFSSTSTFPARGNAKYAGSTTDTATTDPFRVEFHTAGGIWDVDSIQVTGSRHGRAVVCDGDSITAGNQNHGVESTNSWPIQLAAGLGTSWRVQNAGVSAQRLDDMAADLTGETLRYYTIPLAVEGRPIYVCWEYINQAGVSTAAQVHDKIKAICQSAQAAGFLVVVCTDFHTTAASGGTGTICHDASELVRADWTDYANALADLDRGDLRTDSAGVDNTHLSTTGWGIVAGVVQTAVSGL